MSSRLRHQAVQALGLLETVAASSRGGLAGGGGCSIRRLAAPVMAASGVRRSCDTELSSVLRSRSVSAASRACSASLGDACALERTGRSERRSVASSSLLGPATAGGARGSRPPARRGRRLACRRAAHRAPGARERVGPSARLRPWLEGPVRHRSSSSTGAANAGSARRSRPERVRPASSSERPPRLIEHVRHVTCGDPRATSATSARGASSRLMA